MAMTPMQIILAIILAFALFCCNCQSIDPGVSSSWEKLQISPDTLTFMEYGDFLVEIYEHANNHKATTSTSQKKYFYSPLALLDQNSAVSVYNNVTNQPEMRFRVEMWNDKVQKEVVKHLKISIGQEIQSDKVRVIPLEKVILTSKRPTVDYWLYPEWTNYDESKILWFSLSCHEQKICDKLANEMRSKPEQFDHLKLLYSLSSQTSQTKHTTISIDSVTSGQLVSTLLQKFKDKKEIFLTASDEKKMLAEMVTNIRMDTFDDYEVVSPDTESQILNILKDLLVTSRTTIREQSDKMWDSVFWHEDNHRPDWTTKTLNEIINELDKETQKKLADMFPKAEKQSDVIQISNSSNQDEEVKMDGETGRSNQTNDANENEMRRSEATDQEQTSRNQTRDDKSTTSRDDTNVTAGVLVFDDDTKVAIENINTHNTEQENETSENAKKISNEHNRNVENKEKIQHNYDSNSWADVDRISSTISGKMWNDSFSRPSEILTAEVENILQKSRNHVQWDGEKFVPKPIQLSRINLDTFRDSQSFQDHNIRVSYTTAELSAPIKVMERARLTITDELNNLKDELKDTKELLRTTVMNLVNTNTELGNVKSDLTNKLAVTKQELEKSKIELDKTMANVNNYTTKLKELAEIKITTANLSTELKKCDANFQRIGQEEKELKVAEENLKKELEETRQELENTKTELKETGTDLRKNFDDLLAILNAKLEQLGFEFKVTADNLRKELEATLSQLETATTYLSSTRMELSSTKSAVADLTTQLNERTSEKVDIGKMPNSCADLQRMGHKLSGFFSVKGSKKMEMIYCNFNADQNDTQKWIGYADVKSAPVHFYVQRNSECYNQYTPITFNLARVNEGNAMNLASGIFTAPRPGIYFFSFTGVARLKFKSSSLIFSASSHSRLSSRLYLNGNLIASSFVQEYNSATDQFSPLTLQSTLSMKKGDRVWVAISYSGSYSNFYLHDDGEHNTHFTGFMLEEEIGASL
ncbi:repetitive organellar protein-like isoform X2 [Daphnia pulex]|uniref:repetitive organellar protein-like isoform X2 n=1 Tax=Daphnia pulex TaxID=6669 RepID=UPI001EDCEF7A|nr:repetitive organellar protein-like isoform X2 [Daphnia pulex]